MSKPAIRVSGAEAANDFRSLLARVRAGAEVVIERDAEAVAVIRPAAPHVPLLSDSLRLAKKRGSSATLDDEFGRDLEAVVSSHREPLTPPAWDGFSIRVSRLRPSVAATPFKRFSSAPVDATGDQEAALSTVAVVELVHGIHRADTAERRARREVFVEELLAAVAVYPLTTDSPGSPASWRAAAKPRNRDSIADLLIGATAFSLGYSVLTVNPRHFQRVPGLAVIQL